jgi:D-threo-aldose 1-dehydrogenase
LNPHERVKLGRTALTVTRFGLGTAPLAGLFEAVSDAQGTATIERAWDDDIRFFDTAPLYGHGLAEMRLGKVLKQKPRDAFTLASKVGRLLRADVPPEPGQSFRGTPPVNPMFDFTYDGVMRSFEESLERLASTASTSCTFTTPMTTTTRRSPARTARWTNCAAKVSSGLSVRG